jgi:hypothetical protein
MVQHKDVVNMLHYVFSSQTKQNTDVIILISSCLIFKHLSDNISAAEYRSFLKLDVDIS